MFDLVSDIIEADTNSLKKLALVAGYDPSNFFRGADLTNVDLRGQDLTGVDLTGAQLEGILIDHQTRVDEQFSSLVLEAASPVLHTAPPLSDQEDDFPLNDLSDSSSFNLMKPYQEINIDSSTYIYSDTSPDNTKFLQEALAQPVIIDENTNKSHFVSNNDSNFLRYSTVSAGNIFIDDVVSNINNPIYNNYKFIYRENIYNGCNIYLDDRLLSEGTDLETIDVRNRYITEVNDVVLAPQPVAPISPPA